MLRIFRWLVRIVTGILLLGVATGFLLFWFFSRSVPDYGETLTVSGITAPVEIVRDNANVPHIFGATDPDVYFGLGMVHAQDRLWQLLLLRRTAQGRLSELFGARTVRTDELLRRLDFYPAAVRSLAAQDDYTLAALEAYAAGVNAWLTEVNEGARGRGAPEFWLFEPVVAPWQPADTIAIGKLIGLDLSSHLETEVQRARLALVLPEERLRDILPDTPRSRWNGYRRLPITVRNSRAKVRRQQHGTRSSRDPVTSRYGRRIKRLRCRPRALGCWRHTPRERPPPAFNRANNLVSRPP